MALKVGINGFGRIGRNIYRAAWDLKPDFEIVAVNDIGDAKTFGHLLKHDTALGTFAPAVKVDGDTIQVDGHKVKFLTQKDPAELPWKDLGVEIVVESTGLFTDAHKARVHIDKGGAKKVIISAPATNQDYTVVMGVNHKGYDPKAHNVISNASCTTNCFVPLAKVLHDSFGIERGMMTTIHAYTADQKLQDLPHKDLRRARAAADNIIPTSTGANRAVAEVLPELAGKFAGISFRVPILDVSVVDLTVQLGKTTTAQDINAAFEEAASGELRGILAVSHEELVSSDFKNDPHSSIVDAPSTAVLAGDWAKVVSWYDNEWGFSCRMVDLMSYMADRL
ncbi:MAG: type I glyceraldehyde-3-phosphate dehydrogenase [Chloroflexi bacterium]|nr:MAG: type I glyceraldehyde-3-phosphate dehydrogenase [Chloroflexota bacterium]TME02506.1 MAG: type I glyceraldehyde-3-phosphate dehydrogenase [Chloroflexota bacterium]TME40203.1 MAG: type I glyceraldehyde-3-phosphate dehydrogenase [Chloroflexota bacterium]TME53155.1 MAG: type I glyceraldehyde-3-phosphate dehydrogenase [Chloroflexota bacterium]